MAAFDEGTAASPENRAALADYAATLRSDPEVVEVGHGGASVDGRAALTSVAWLHQR